MAVIVDPQGFKLDWLERAPFCDFDPRFRAALRQWTVWPTPQEYGGLAQSVCADCVLPTFVKHDALAVTRAGGYEVHVSERRAVPTRERNWHDFFNMVVWAHLPRTRWALNRVHTSALAHEADPRNGRTAAQNVAAHFDEVGMLVLSRDQDVLKGLEQLEFKQVLYELRHELSHSTRFVLVGHGMLESMLRPHLGLVAKALLVPCRELPAWGPELWRRADRLGAEGVGKWLRQPCRLAPVPVLGIPGWSQDQTAEFYDNTRYFRRHRFRQQLRR